MGPVENEVFDQEYENDDFSGTAETDFENDWDGSHKSTPNQISSQKISQARIQHSRSR